MASDTWKVRLTGDRETKMGRIDAIYDCNNRADVLDVSLDAALQLHEIVEDEVETLQERTNLLSGDAITVQNPTVRI